MLVSLNQFRRLLRNVENARVVRLCLGVTLTMLPSPAAGETASMHSFSSYVTVTTKVFFGRV